MGMNDWLTGPFALAPMGPKVVAEPTAMPSGEADAGCWSYRRGGVPESATLGWEAAWIDLGGEG